MQAEAEEAGCDHASLRSLYAVSVSEIENGKRQSLSHPRRRALCISAAPVTLGHHGCHIRKVLKWFPCVQAQRQQSHGRRRGSLR